MNRNNNKGFTLVELIATIVILSIILSIGAYSIIKIINSSSEKEYKLLINEINSASELYYQECRYSDDIIYSCYYDFNFDGELTSRDAALIQECIDNGFSGNTCEYVNVFGDIDRNGVIDNDDAIYILYNSMPMFSDEYGPIEKNKFFTSLDKLVTLGYLSGNGKNEDKEFTLVNPKTKKDIGNCVVAVEYSNGKFKITNKGSINDVNEKDCPTNDDYNE